MALAVGILLLLSFSLGPYLGVAVLGLMAGVLHVLAGPDHLAAIAPLAIQGQGRKWFTGLLWGVGHTGGVWLVALLAFVLRSLLPVEELSSWSERLVGLTLIGIGLWGVHRGLAQKDHVHSHRLHTHAAGAVGVLHGLAGSAHFLGVLPALALPTPTAMLSYLVAFGVGSIIAMAGFAWLVGGVLGNFVAVGRNAFRWMLTGFSAAAIAVGGVWLAI